MADLVLHLRLLSLGLAFGLLGLGCLLLCVLRRLGRVESLSLSTRGRASVSLQRLERIEPGVVELVRDKREREAAEARSIEHRRRMVERMQAEFFRRHSGPGPIPSAGGEAAEAEEGGDDGEAGEEAGSAEVEDPQG